MERRNQRNRRNNKINRRAAAFNGIKKFEYHKRKQLLDRTFYK